MCHYIISRSILFKCKPKKQANRLLTPVGLIKNPLDGFELNASFRDQLFGLFVFPLPTLFHFHLFGQIISVFSVAHVVGRIHGPFNRYGNFLF